MGIWNIIFMLCACLWATAIRAEDPYIFFTWNVTYGTISPLGVPQQAILINGKFPGPNINSTTNNNIVLNVFNNIDEPILFTWYIFFNLSLILTFLCVCIDIYIYINI